MPDTDESLEVLHEAYFGGTHKCSMKHFDFHPFLPYSYAACECGRNVTLDCSLRDLDNMGWAKAVTMIETALQECDGH